MILQNSYPNLFQFALIVSHVLAGVIGLFVAPVALAVAKGGKTHRLFGKIFFWCMAWVFVSVIGLAFFRFSFFLLVVSVLSFYSALVGYRALYMKKPTHGDRPIWLDWLASISALLFGTALTLVSAINLITPGFIGIVPVGAGSIIGLIFGGSLVASAVSNIRSYRNPSTDKMAWYYTHIGNMLGAYGAMVTAFSVNVISRMVPESVAWLLWITPTMLTSIATVLWINRSKARFNARATKLA